MTRDEFIAKFDEIFRHRGPSCIHDSHPLWEAEKSYDPRINCVWFLCVKPLQFMAETKSDYWYWVTTTLTGRIACFSSDNLANEEWWGFENKNDAVVWALKWVK